MRGKRTVGIDGAVRYQELNPMTSSGCARMDQVLLGRNVDKVVDD